MTKSLLGKLLELLEKEKRWMMPIVSFRILRLLLAARWNWPRLFHQSVRQSLWWLHQRSQEAGQIQARKTMIRARRSMWSCSNANSLSSWSSWSNICSIQFPCGVWLGARSDHKAGSYHSSWWPPSLYCCASILSKRDASKCSISIMATGKQTAWILTFALGWTGMVDGDDDDDNDNA